MSNCRLLPHVKWTEALSMMLPQDTALGRRGWQPEGDELSHGQPWLAGSWGTSMGFELTEHLRAAEDSESPCMRGLLGMDFVDVM